ncbi:MAG: histidinol-phosphatase HisJ family protein [Clostridia bacterium]|nr:histidinol-phosphatase HisJ family protein [Clostridia bacterium]
MILSDFHVHTTFCDGAHSPRKMVEAAIEKGMDAIGFSAHSYTYFDESYCLKKADIPKYKQEISALKEEFKRKIRVYLGIEQDVYSAADTAGYDYVIGSAHYVLKDDRFYAVDNSEAAFCALGEDIYGGDYIALCEDYFKSVSRLAEKRDITFIGHFDLITKFNEGGKYFDESHPRYIAAWQKAMDALLPLKIPFEVNTGAIARGCRTSPYPALPVLNYIKENGGKVIFSGDTHHKDCLCYAFDSVLPQIAALHIPIVTL